MPSETVHVHADESCLGNQFRDRRRPGGAAGLVEDWTSGRWVARDYWISEPDTTNNRMALRSAIEALRALAPGSGVRIVSDSQYLVKGISQWLPGWKARGWTRKAGTIENLELWKTLDHELGRHVVNAHWVRGHTGHARNEYANHLAVRAAEEQSCSPGLVDSGFVAWLADERARGRYLDFVETAAPEWAP